MALPPHLADLEGRLKNRFGEAVAEFRRAVEAELRQVSDRSLAAIGALPAPELGDWLPESTAAELDLAPRRESSREALGTVADALRKLDVAGSQAEALDALLDGVLAWVDRAALVLARDRGLTGWGDRGFGDAPLAGRELEWDTTLRERMLASRGCLRLDAETAAEVLAEFGAAAAGAAVVVPLVLRDRVAALLWADRRDGELELAPLQILVHAAGQRLELQALSERAYSPTLWEGAEAPGAPLPLWTVLAPAPAAEPEPESAVTAEAEPEPTVAETAAIDAPAVEPESGAPDGPAEPAGEAVSEVAAEELGAELWEGAESEAEAPIAEAPAGAVDEEAAALPGAAYAEISESAEAIGEVSPPEPAFERDFEAPVEPAVESAAEAAEAERWEPEPEPEEAPATEPTAAAAETEPPPTDAPVETFGTVRMELPKPDSWDRPREETTAPLPAVEPAPEPPSPAGTQEVEAPAAAADEPTAEPGDAEATQLSMRRPPTPPPTTPPEPPTWSSAPAAPPAADEHPMDRTGSRFGRSTEVAPPPDVSGPGLAFLGGRASRATADPAHEEAKRLARLLISEIRLYNEEQVLEGRRHRDLYHRLKEDIDRSRQIYDERVDAAVRDEVDYFQQELVRSLAGGDSRALGI